MFIDWSEIKNLATKEHLPCHVSSQPNMVTEEGFEPTPLKRMVLG